ncbi:hypothetical protein HELRODRAFT_179325 [Helobdella robusta]|uniref:Uncharacterized protein n=1 Tax=Helobdella robusta TaxID=6412 RepID=T1FEJ8_HELRO|nr:hypothetical protein HELRODRAFT_179325 [Helobdella robusta]ESN95549.1 hypothetical protein HELRODRAFT_179325 [Helobdella robusta]
MVLESSSARLFQGFLVVDGLLEFPFCYSSEVSDHQWIQVDLIWSYLVESVEIYGKSSTNELIVSLRDSTNRRTAPCKNLTSQLANINVTFQCSNPAEHASRYIRVDHYSSPSGNMSICEVVVRGQLDGSNNPRTNLLLKRPALMNSSINATNVLTNKYMLFDATLVVDGIRDVNIDHGHCAHSGEVGFAQNWMQVDMGRDYVVDYIALVSRWTTSNNVPRRVSNFIIGLTSQIATEVPPTRGEYPLCNRYPGAVPKASRVTLQCSANLPAYRYIIAHQAVGAYDGYFSVCELEAYEPMPQMINPHKQLKWNSEENFQLRNYSFVEFPSGRPSFCIARCMALGDFECDSFNFNDQLMICQLNKHRNGFQNESLIFSPDWSFWNATYYNLGRYPVITFCIQESKPTSTEFDSSLHHTLESSITL